MPTFNTTDPKPGFVYDQVTDTWYPLLGLSVQSLDELSDVSITTPSTGQILAYDGTNWINQTETGDISAVTSGNGIEITNGTGPVPTIAIANAPVLSSPILIGPEERVNVVGSAATGTVALDTLTAGTMFYTSNATGNWTLNVRGSATTSLDSILTTNDSITVVFLNTNGVTAYYPTAFQIDGNAITPKWQGGTAPSAGNASSIDAYVYNIIKTASATFTVLASQTKFA